MTDHVRMPGATGGSELPPRTVADPERLAALDGLAILDTPAEQEFDDVVRLATRLCDVPVALVSPVASDRQWIKARVGFPRCETDLNSSVCRYVLDEPDLLVIEDLAADRRTAANPLVTGDPFIRFYAGAPLRMPDGLVLGSLCVIDTEPRAGGLTGEQADDLRALARQVSGLLAMRRAVEHGNLVLDSHRAELRQARRIDVLAKASLALLTATDPAAVLAPILTANAETLGFDRSYTYDLWPDGRHLRLTHSLGATTEVQDFLRRMPYGAPLCGIVAESRRPLIVADLQAGDDPHFSNARGIGLDAYAGFPVTSRGGLRGGISFASTVAPAFDAEAIGFFEALARMMSAVYERLDGERALRESDARSRRAQEAGQVGTFEVEVDTGLMSVSPEFAKVYGRPPTGLYSTDAFESLIVPEDRGVGSSETTRRDGSAPPDVEYRINRADDGELRWISRRATFGHDDAGRVVRMFGTVQDVTEQRVAQEALRESEEELRIVIASAKDHAILTTDTEGAVTSWSAGAQATFGWSVDEIIGRSADVLFTPDDRADGVPARELSTAGREGCSNDERWHLTKAGGRVFMNGSVHPLPRDAQGRERGFIKVARDETGRRRMEDALRESEARFRTILDTVETAFAIVEVKFDGDDRPVDYRFVEANPAFERQAGVDLRGKWVTEFAPELERFWFETYGHVARTGEPANFESYAEAFGRWFDVRAVRLGKPDDRRIAIFFGDVTARRQAEADLRASEALARENIQRVQLALAAGAIIGTWFWDLPTDRFTVDEGFAQSFGLDPALGREGIPLAQIVATVHPDDQAGLAAAIADVIARGGAYAHQYRVRRADGRYYWIEANGRVDKAADGTPTSFPGVLLDVDGRRAAEARRDALLALGDRLRDLTTVDALTNAACEVLGANLGAMLVGYGDVDPRRETITVERDWTAGEGRTLAGRLNFRDFGSYVEDLKRGETVVVADCRDDARTAARAEALERFGARAFVNAPVFERGAFVALLYVSTAEPREWSAEEVAFVREVASRLRLAVARVRAEADQGVLNEEISHRLKNTFAMVLSIAGQTLRTVPDRAPVEAFEKRIHAFSQAHDILLRKSWAAAPAKEVVKAVLAGAGHGDRIDVSGPEFDLGPRATLSLSLLLHELATNAAKYGALSVPAGRVAIDWRLEGEGEGREVALDWTERGGPPANRPAGGGRKGFGSRLIGMGLVGTGGVDLRFTPSGFEATMRASLAQLQQS